MAPAKKHLRIATDPDIGIFGRRDPHIIPTATDCAYAAGFFDGEGYITIAMDHRKETARGPIFNMRCGASQNDIHPLIWLRDRWGGSITAMSRKTTTQNVTYTWNCFARKAAKFLTDLQPFLQVKAERAAIALTFQSEKYIPGTNGLPPEARARMLDLRQQLAALNTHRPTQESAS